MVDSAHWWAELERSLSSPSEAVSDMRDGRPALLPTSPP